jgi:ABC-type bacteriocin/lantibiotic exporter with double-glycine peptidase domain
MVLDPELPVKSALLSMKQAKELGVTSPAKSQNSLWSIFRLQCQLLGRRVYLLFALMPFATLFESLGITLLLPLFSTMAGGDLAGDGPVTSNPGGALGKVLRRLPFPASPGWLLTVILIAFLLKATIRFGTDALNGYFQAALMHRLKVDFVRAYSRLDFLAFSSRSTGHYINIVTLQAMRFARTFLNISQATLQLLAGIIYLAVAAFVNWKFALIAAVGGIIFTVLSRLVTNFVRRVSQQTAVEQTNLNKQLIQVIQALKYLMATGRAVDRSQQVRESCDRLFDYEVRMNWARAFSSAIREPLSVLLVLVLVVIQVFVFQQPLGEIFILLLLLHRATQSAFGVQSNWQMAMEQAGSAEMIRDEMGFVRINEEPVGTVPIPAFHDAIVLEKVTFSYDDSEVPVLKELTLSIPHNKTVALVGHSGAGKSTMADMLTLMLRPSKGRILIDGVNTTDASPSSWRSQIGYVCQETIVFDDSVAANICLNESGWQVDPDIRIRIEKAAIQAFLHDFIESLPDGYGTIVGDRGVRLSGGQRQRLFIARELYKNPSLLILDEATSALDGDSEKAIQASIEALQGQMTVILIAHRLATIRNADLIFVLERGELVEQGTFDDLNRQDESRFCQMVKLQSL